MLDVLSEEKTKNEGNDIGPLVWDCLASHTSLPRAACKSLIYCLIYGGPVLKICRDNKLGITEIMLIRTTFDDIMEGHIAL